MDAQKHVRIRRLGDVDAFLQILPLAGFACGISVRQAHILPPCQHDLCAAGQQCLFHLKGDLQRHVLFPAAAVLSPRPAVIAAVSGVQRHDQAAERAGSDASAGAAGVGGVSFPPSARPPAVISSAQQQAGAQSFRLFCYNFV